MDKNLKQKENKKKEGIWRDIKNFEGLYQVSNEGLVKSLERTVAGKNGSERTIRERILKPSTNGYGYLQVILCNGSGKRKTFKVHRLVCEAFPENWFKCRN